MNKRSLTRRQFIQISSGAVAAAKVTLLPPTLLSAAPPSGGSERRCAVRLDWYGRARLRTAAGVAARPGFECVAVCDLYDSRHGAAREAVKKNVPATRNYKEILDRNDMMPSSLR